MQKFLQSGWATQGFKTKKRRQAAMQQPEAAQQPADAKQKKRK